MYRIPPLFTRTDTLYPTTTLFRSDRRDAAQARTAQLRHLRRKARLCGRPAAGTGGMARGEAGPADLRGRLVPARLRASGGAGRSEEQTSELQSLMRISYAVLCLKQTNIQNTLTNYNLPLRLH